MIDVEFYGGSRAEKQVAIAWKEYLDHLNGTPSAANWANRGNDLFVELLHKMAVCLGYDFDKVHIKNQSYSPIAHGNLEAEQNLIRRGTIALLRGELALPVKVGEPVHPPSLEMPDARAAARPIAELPQTETPSSPPRGGV